MAPAGDSTEVSPALTAGPRSLSPAGKTAAAYDSVSSFPFVSSDRNISLDDFGALLTDAVASAAPIARDGNLKADVATYLTNVRNTTPTHRQAAGVRAIHVYSDAPVLVVGSFAILPGDDGAPVDPSQFMTVVAGTSHYDAHKVAAYAASNPDRCIALFRSHPSNDATGVILLAARNIVVKGRNFTDGLSLTTFAENLVMADERDALILSPGSRTSGDIKPAVLPVDVPDAISAIPRYAPLGKEANGKAITAHGQDGDLAFQLAKAKEALASGIADDRRGLAGLAGGHWLSIALRSTPLHFQSLGQDGGAGQAGDRLDVQCNGSAEWYASFPTIKPSNYFDCRPGATDPRYHSTDPSYCGRMCALPPAEHNGGPGGPPGTGGSVFVYAATPITGCLSDFDEWALADAGHRGPLDAFDQSYAYDRACSDGKPQTEGGAIDCADPLCADDPNVTVCGASKADALPVPWTPPTPVNRTPPKKPTEPPGPRAPQPPLPEYARAPSSAPGSAAVGADDSIVAAAPSGSLTPAPTSTAALGGGFTGLGGLGGIPIDICTRRAPASFTTTWGGPGASGGGAVSPTLLCVDKTSTNPGNNGIPSTAVYCAMPNGAAGPNAPYSWATIGGFRYDGVVSRAQWAIALDRLHPMELRRRLAVADHRFRKDARASAYTRYLAARYIIEANQRRAEAGGTGNGTVFDCNTTGTMPDGLAEICGLRIAVDAKLRSLDQGESFHGYGKLYTPPASIPVASWVKCCGDEVTAAQSAIDTWSTQARVRYGSQDSSGQWDLTLEADVATLEQTLAPGGDLAIQYTHATDDKTAAIAKIAALQQKQGAIAVSLAVINTPRGTQMKWEDLTKFVISTAIKVGVTALAPEFAAAVIPLSDAVAGAIGDDASSNAQTLGMSEKNADDLGKSLSSTAKIFSDKEDAKKWFTGEATSVLTSALLPEEVSSLAGGADSEAARALKKNGLNAEAAQAVLDLREASRTLAQSVREIELIESKQREARSAVMRMRANQAAMRRNRFGLGYLDLLLKARYDAALEHTYRAGELVFLTQRAAAHAMATWAISPAGARTNQLTPLLDACGGKDGESLDVGFENVACFGERVRTVDRLFAAQAQAFPFDVSGHVTVVAPVEPWMLRHEATRDVYDVPVDVSLDTLAPSYADTRLHTLTDVAILVDTGAAAGRVRGDFLKDSAEIFWLGPTALPRGADPVQFIGFSYGREAPVAGAVSASAMSAIFASPEWTLTPDVVMQFCTGTAAQNQAILDSSTTSAQGCRLTDNAQIAPAYVGRSLLGRYRMTVGASSVVGASAVRADFRFLARRTH